MQTKEAFKVSGTSSLGMFSPESEEKIKSLPIFKHLSEGELSKQVDSFRRGEKGIFWFLKAAVVLGGVYAIWTYVLPPILMKLGAAIGTIAQIGIWVLAVILAPVAFGWMRKLARTLQKALIESDPFMTIANERVKIIKNQKDFLLASAKIINIRNDMELEAAKSEKDATNLQDEIIKIQKSVQKKKATLDEMTVKQGVAARETDEYVNLQSEYMKELSKSDVVRNKLNQAKDFITKYGSRAAIMKKFSHKLKMVETQMEIKLNDFDATVEILKKDYEFASKSRIATETAKSAMLFTKGWELEYALDFVTTKIAEDIAITSGNIRDIDSLTTYSVDSDELYDNLNKLAEGIKVGEDVVPQAKVYSNPEYKLTHEDKIKSGGFSELM